MRSAATVLLRALTNQQRTAGARSFADDAARRWLEYRPRPRPGACIAPACVSYAGRPVSRPLAPEEDLARALLDALGPAGRATAVISDTAPADIRTGTRPRADERIEPLGLPASRLGPTPRALLGRLVALYLDRLPIELAAREAARLTSGELHFAREGPMTPGQRHYYRVQGDDLPIGYDNTASDGNHAHTVLRRPRSDFGDDVLARHYGQAHS